ncbi:MAG: hypothetical protein WCC14_14065 [Acidobacteriaceae bacterium]
MGENAGRAKRKAIPQGMSRTKIHAMRTMAEERGLMSGRTTVVRGRMPESLVEQAKRNTGIKSDTELIRLGLATLVCEDNYGEWLMAHYGTVPPDIDLEY